MGRRQPRVKKRSSAERQWWRRKRNISRESTPIHPEKRWCRRCANPIFRYDTYCAECYRLLKNDDCLTCVFYVLLLLILFLLTVVNPWFLVGLAFMSCQLGDDDDEE